MLCIRCQITQRVPQINFVKAEETNVWNLAHTELFLPIFIWQIGNKTYVRTYVTFVMEHEMRLPMYDLISAKPY